MLRMVAGFGICAVLGDRTPAMALLDGILSLAFRTHNRRQRAGVN